MDCDVIGRLWTENDNSTHCDSIGFTYDIIVQIIVNIIYDIICMI